MIGIFKFGEGMTVKDLKTIIATWPEFHVNGEPTEVWIGGEKNTSNQAFVIYPLNKFDGCADLLLDYTDE